MASEQEEWRDVADFPGYEVSSDGRIRSWRMPGPGFQRRERPRLLRPAQSRGYHQVGLYAEGSTTTRKVHRVVLDTFVGPRGEGMQTRHLNGKKLDNRVCNLAWGTPGEQGADSQRLGEKARGEAHGRARLTVELVRAIRRTTESISNVEWARRLGTAITTIRMARNGETWSSIA